MYICIIVIVYIIYNYIYIHIITALKGVSARCFLFSFLGGLNDLWRVFHVHGGRLLLRLRCRFLHVPMRGTKERGWEGEKWNWHGWCLPIDAPTTYGKLAQCPMIFCHTASTKCLKIYPKHLLQKNLENYIVQGNPPKTSGLRGLRKPIDSFPLTTDLRLSHFETHPVIWTISVNWGVLLDSCMAWAQSLK